MKLKKIQMNKLMEKQDYGTTLEGKIVFSNFGQDQIEHMTFDQFKDADKSNFQSDLQIERNGDKDDYEPLVVSICKKISVDNVKLEDIPLDDVDLTDFKKNDRYSRGQTQEELDGFYNVLKKTEDPIEVNRDSDSEGFLGHFFNGHMKIIPAKQKYKESFSKQYSKNENITFDLEIEGCSMIYHDENTKEAYRENINTIDTLFQNTVIPEVDFELNKKKTTKEGYALQSQLTGILTGRTKKLPAKLFEKFSVNDFKNSHYNDKKKLFIASIKDNSVYQIDE